MPDGDTAKESERSRREIAQAERDTERALTAAAIILIAKAPGSTNAVEREVLKGFPTRSRKLRQTIRAAETRGAKAAQDAYRRETGKELNIKTGRARARAAEKLIRKNARRVARDTAREIDAINNAAKRMVDSAKRAAKSGNPERHIMELRDLAKGRPELRKAIRKQIKRLRKHGDLAKHAKDMQAAIDGAKGKELSRTVRRKMKTAKFRERTVVRTEARAAYNDAFVETIKGQDGVIGLRWTLSPSHPVPDICDVYAGQDLDGLGAGGYAVNDTPGMPAHPNCMCYFNPIFGEKRTRREVSEARKNADGPEAWVGKQPVKVQKQILGPTKLRKMREGKRVFKRRGLVKKIKNIR